MFSLNITGSNAYLGRIDKLVQGWLSLRRWALHTLPCMHVLVQASYFPYQTTTYPILTLIVLTFHKLVFKLSWLNF